MYNLARTIRFTIPVLLTIVFLTPNFGQTYQRSAKSPRITFLNRNQFYLSNPHADVTLHVTIQGRHGKSYGEYFVRPRQTPLFRFAKSVRKDDLEYLDVHYSYSYAAYQTDMQAIVARLNQLGVNSLVNSAVDLVEFENGWVELFKQALQLGWQVNIEQEIRRLKIRQANIERAYKQQSYLYYGSNDLKTISRNLYVFNRQTPLLEIRASYDIVGATNASNNEKRAEGEPVEYSWQRNSSLIPASGRIAIPLLSESQNKTNYSRLYMAGHFQQFSTETNDVGYISPEFVANPDTRNAFRLIEPARIDITGFGATLAFKSVQKAIYYELEAGAMQLTSTMILLEDGLETGFEVAATEIDAIGQKIGFLASGTVGLWATPNSFPMGVYASLSYLRSGLEFDDDYRLFQNIAGTTQYQLPQNIWKLNLGVSLAL